MATIESFSALVTSIQNAAISTGGWEEMLLKISEASGAGIGGLIIKGSEGAPDIVATAGADPAALRSYDRYFNTIDPVIPKILLRNEGEVITQSMVIDRATLTRGEFYNDWLRPQGVDDCLATKIIDMDKPGILAFAVPTQKGMFDHESVRLVQLLVPHLQIAVKTHTLLRGLTLQRDGSMEVLNLLNTAILFVNKSGRVILANRAAEQLLALADGLHGGGVTGLRGARREQTLALHHLIARASGLAGEPASGGSLSLDRPSGLRPLLVSVTPVTAESRPVLFIRAASAIVFVSTRHGPTHVSREALQAMFGLTKAEAGVAQAIASGGGIKGVASGLGIAPSTARTHLHRVFEKTGTRRQAELVHLLDLLQDHKL